MTTVPMSIRISKDAHKALNDAAKREQRTKSSLVERLLLEGLAMQRYPGIKFAGDPPDRRAVVSGTGLDVWEVIMSLRNYGDEAKLIEHLNLRPVHISLAKAYYHDHRDEIDEAIEQNSQGLEYWKKQYPGAFITSK